MEHDGETLYVRKGDMIKFVALPDGAVGGQFELEYLLDIEGEVVRSPNTAPIVRAFPEAGTYTVAGEYKHGNDTVSAALTVVVLEGTFPEESPACLVGRERNWCFEGMPSNVVYEVDDAVEMAVVEHSLSTNSQQPTTVTLKATSANGTHMMVARTAPGGPILDSTKLSPFWIQNAVDGYFWTVEVFEDSELWEVESIARNLPADVDIQIKVIVGGVTLDDYALERWITADDYDEIGEYHFRLFHPNESEASTCHTFKVFQGGTFVGEAYGGSDQY